MAEAYQSYRRAASRKWHTTLTSDVRFGSKADICSAKGHVRFTSNSDRESEFPQRAMSALPPKADMCGAIAHVCYGPEADMCSARLVSAKGQRRKSFQGLLGWQIGHWRSRYRVFDHRGGRRGLRLDPDIIGEAKPTTARSAADLSAPKRGMCRRPAIRSAVNHL
jgi:hypothetical protein